MSLLQQRIDPLSGESEWVVVADESEEEGASCPQDASFSPLQHTTYLDMLNDQHRNKAFERAIRKAVRGAHHVLDIGAGTGLLSMMALRSMQDASQERKYCGTQPDDLLISCSCKENNFVTACESYLPMRKLAHAIIRENGVKAGVHLLPKHSDELHVGIDMFCRADVLVSEILDSELLGEGVIPTFSYAHKHLLKPNARTIPYRAVFYGQIVESEPLWRYIDLEGVEKSLDDGLYLSPIYSKQIALSRSSQYPLHVDPLSSTLHLLSEPFEVFSFEFWKTLRTWSECTHHIKVSQDGKAHAIVSWWVVQLDEEGEVYYSTAPSWIKKARAGMEFPEDDSEPSAWCDHWKQCIWFLPMGGLPVQTGEILEINAMHDEISIRYNVRKRDGIAYGPSEGFAGFQKLGKSLENYSALKPERIGMLGDQTRRHKIAAGVSSALKGRSYCHSIILDDSLISTIMVTSEISCSHTFVFLPSTKDRGNLVEQTAALHQFSSSKVSVLTKRPSELRISDLGGVQIDAIFAEPYYLGSESWLPWQLLRFWHEKTMLKSLLSENYTLVPCQAKLQGRAFYLPDLWRSRCSLTKVEGFEHSLANKFLGACGFLPEPFEVPILPYAIWQCGEHEALTDIFTLMRFDLHKDMEMVKGLVKVPISKPGTCHGIVLWMDWILDPLAQLVLSSGPSDVDFQPNYWKQGIKLLRSPVLVNAFHSNDDLQRSSTPSKSNAPNMLVVTSLFESCKCDVTIDLEFTSSIG